VAIAKTAGFVISAETIKNARQSQGLSDEELESVAGGWSGKQDGLCDTQICTKPAGC